MAFLFLLELALASAILWLLITQLIIPVFCGGKLFPLFKTSPIREQVEETRNEVNDLADKQSALKEYNALLKRSQNLHLELDQLEAEIAKTKSKQSPEQQTNPTQPTTGANQQ